MVAMGFAGNNDYMFFRFYVFNVLTLLIMMILALSMKLKWHNVNCSISHFRYRYSPLKGSYAITNGHENSSLRHGWKIHLLPAKKPASNFLKVYRI